MPASQAGRRGFESHLPLHKINLLQAATCYDSTTLVELPHGTFQHSRLCLSVFVLVNINTVPSELSAHVWSTLGLAKLRYPRPAQHLEIHVFAGSSGLAGSGAGIRLSSSRAARL
jgi:hypothetical protein